MTNNRMCLDCGIRKIVECGLCTPCSDYAMAENSHSDDAHDSVTAGTLTLDTSNFKNQDQLDTFLADARDAINFCPVCNPDLDYRSATKRTGHTNTVAKSYTSHAACKHPRTPKDRAACRKARTV